MSKEKLLGQRLEYISRGCRVGTKFHYQGETYVVVERVTPPEEEVRDGDLVRHRRTTIFILKATASERRLTVTIVQIFNNFGLITYFDRKIEEEKD